MSTTDPNSGIVHTWARGENGWGYGMDADLQRISRASYHLGVLDKDVFNPPSSPSDGDAYIVAAGGIGDWIGQDGNIAYWDSSEWVFYTPSEGWYADVADEDIMYRYNGTAWTAYGNFALPQEDWVFVETVTFTYATPQPIVVSVPAGCAQVKIVGERVSVNDLHQYIDLAVNGAASNNQPYAFSRHETDQTSRANFNSEGTSDLVIANANMSADSMNDFEVLVNLGAGSTYTSMSSVCTSTDSAAGAPVSVQAIGVSSYKVAGRPAALELTGGTNDIQGTIHLYKSSV